MDKGGTVMRGSVARIALLVTVLLGSVAAVGRPGGASAQVESAPLDLAAIPLTPEEVEAIGLEGYGWSYGWLRTPCEVVRDMAPYYGVEPEEFERTMVAEAGLTRHYYLRDARPVERGTPGTLSSRSVFTAVFEFASAEGAVAGERYMGEIGGRAGAEPVTGNRTFGDAARILRYSMREGFSGLIEEMLLTIRTDTLYIELTVSDPIQAGEEPEPPTVGELEAMASRLMIRVGAARASDLPDLGNRMVRLGVAEEAVRYAGDRYDVEYGRNIRRFSGTLDAHAAIQKTIEESGVLHAYVVNQTVGNDLFDPTAPGMMMTVYRLVGEREAATWFAFAPDWSASWPYFVQFEPLDEAIEIGDEAAAFATTLDFGGGQLPGHVLFVRSGTDVFEVRVHDQDGVSLETAVALARIQLTCLAGDPCPERVPVPDDMREA